ncbi:MAG: RHS repeat-associated core domain-containing protein [Saprospiraceae bacterium]|nr:RHS repeat-associated core domain-containing protein [Saprospiraceae bacterium]
MTKDYCQGIEYKDGKVEAVYGQEGRLTAVYDQYGVTLTRFRAEYWLKDHLGNTRIAFADDNHNGTIEVWDDPSTQENEAEITQENHYYPFGMNQEGPWYATIGPRNGYQYNGKELNEELELGWNDFGARWQDPATGRWWQVDPLGEKYVNISSYAYAVNNPIIFIDNNGDSIDVYNPEGELLYTVDDGKKEVKGLYFQKSSTDSEGNVTYSDGLSFSYNDPDEDRKSVKEDGFRIKVTSMRDIQDMVLGSGAGSAKHPYQYAYKEGKKDQKLDFFVQNPERIPTHTLSIIIDRKGTAVAYNPKDYGNFMFGLSMRFLGIPLSHAKIGAHGNNFFNGRRDGSDRWRMLDSKGDQRAIRNGYYLNIKIQAKVYLYEIYTYFILGISFISFY